MGDLRVSLIHFVCIVACIGFSYAQISARNTVPETVASCYRNTTAYNRYTRLPMHIDNLISIVRKIEQKNPQWDTRRIARTLVNRYMFDGIDFQPNAKPDFAFIPVTEESAKTGIIRSLIPIPLEEILPTGTLDNDELCSLHWMLSHSMNSTARDEERGYYNPYNPNPFNSQGGSVPSYDTGLNSNNNNNNNPPLGGWRGKRSVLSEDGGFSESQEKNPLDISNEEDPSPQSPPAAVANEASAEEPIIPPSSVTSEEETPAAPVARGRSFPRDEDEKTTGGSKSARQISTNDPNKTRRPIETGVVYTKWGSISAGRLIAGIAAGLEPVTIPIGNFGSPYPSQPYGGSNAGSNPYNPGQSYNPAPQPYSGGGSSGGSFPFRDSPNLGGDGQGNAFGNPPQPQPNYGSKNQWAGRKKRQVPGGISFQALQSIFGATLAGDVGQAAILNAKNQLPNIEVPRGVWNDTGCPREFILGAHPLPNQEIYDPAQSWSYLTEAEIRGGMDGLIIGMNIRRWDPSGTMKLSEILSMYYSELGVVTDTLNQGFRSCDRGSLFMSSVDSALLREQSRSFAYLYNNNTKVIPYQNIETDINQFYSIVDEAFNKMYSVANNIIPTMDPKCIRTAGYSSGTVDKDDNLKFTEIRSTIFAVLDHTASLYEIEDQKRFLANLVQEINVSPQGSRLGIVDGSTGYMSINPNSTDIGPRLACNIMSLPTQMKNQNIAQVLGNIRSELERMRDEEKRYAEIRTAVPNNGITILILVHNKKLDNNQGSIKGILEDINSKFGDVQVIFASSRYQKNDFAGIALNPDTDFIRIQAAQNMSDSADEFATELRKTTLARLTYPRCHSKDFDQNEEHRIAKELFVTPDTIQYYQISPDYFYSAKNLRLRFTSDYGKVRICESRSERFPNTRNTGNCRETSGNYVNPGSSQIDIEFSYSKPCGKHGERSGCSPIYFSFTPTVLNTGIGGGIRDCSIEGCQTKSDVKVTFTHWDMRCNGAMGILTSLPMATFTAIISLLIWRSST